MARNFRKDSHQIASFVIAAMDFMVRNSPRKSNRALGNRSYWRIKRRKHSQSDMGTDRWTDNHSKTVKVALTTNIGVVCTSYFLHSGVTRKSTGGQLTPGAGGKGAQYELIGIYFDIFWGSNSPQRGRKIRV